MPTRIWVCPALCGCELQITADWADEDVNGRSYKHPASSPDKNTISDIQIVNKCAIHDTWDQALLDADPYFGARGYMPIPTNPTPAEFLYLNLYRYTGQLDHLDTCTCKIAQTFDRSNQSGEIKQHPIHTKRCKYHLNDTDHSIALAERQLKEDTLAQLKQAHPELLKEIFDDEGVSQGFDFKRNVVTWKYNQQRELEITLPTLSTKQKDDFNKLTDVKVKIM